MVRLWVDHRPRIAFYVDHGLVARTPSDEQLRRVARLNQANAGVVERLRYYTHHPLEMLPGYKRSLPTNAAVLRGATEDMQTDVGRGDDAKPAVPARTLDRFLEGAFRMSPVRFGVQTLFNPWNPIPATGLCVPARFLINHVVHAPHPSAVWDVQLIHPDPGALEELERQIDLAEGGIGLRSRVFRAMANRPGYYDYLRDLVERVRRFDYPPTPPRFNPVLENLVTFLNRALSM